MVAKIHIINKQSKQKRAENPRTVKKSRTQTHYKVFGGGRYFADPYASWQKGAIENTNKLIRQYIPKQANFDDFTDKKMASIQKKINSRPRQKLRFETPKAEFFKRIA